MPRPRSFPGAVLAATAALLLVAPAAAIAAPPSWLAPTEMVNSGGAVPRVVATPDGSVTVIWREEHSGNGTIHACTQLARATTPCTPTMISDPNEDVGGETHVVLADANGNVTAGWATPTNAAMFRTLPAGQTDWAGTDPIQVTGAGEAVNGADFQVGGDGTLKFIYASNTAGAMQMRAITRSAEGVWSDPVPLGASSNTDSNSNVVADFNAAGDGVAVWTTDVGGNRQMRIANYTASTDSWASTDSFSSHDVVPTDGSAGWGSQDVTINDAGDVGLVWIDDTGPGTLATRNVGSVTWATEPLFRDGHGGMMTQLAADKENQIVAVWHDQLGMDTSTTSTATRTWTRAHGWTDEENALPGGGGGAPTLAVNVNGDMALSVLTSSDNVIFKVGAVYRASGSSAFTGWAVPVVGTHYANGLPRVAVDDLGNSYVAYASPTGGIGYAIGDGTGPVLGTISAPSVGTVGVPFSVSLATEPFDLFSSVASTSWAFGADGSMDSQGKVTYTSEGEKTITVTAIDGVDNVTTDTVTVRIAPAPADEVDEPVVLAPKPSPKDPLPAVLKGRTITILARITLRSGQKCSGKAVATTKFGTTTYRTTVKLATTVFPKSGKVCAASGTIRLKKTPSLRTKLRVTVASKTLKSRTLTTTR